MAQLVQYIKYLFDVTDRQIDFRMFRQEQYDDFGLNLHNPDHPIYNELGWTSNHADMVEEYFMKEEENKKWQSPSAEFQWQIKFDISAYPNVQHN